MLYGHCVRSLLCPVGESDHGEALFMLTLAETSEEEVKNKRNHAHVQATATPETEVICPCGWLASFERKIFH